MRYLIPPDLNPDTRFETLTLGDSEIDGNMLCVHLERQTGDPILQIFNASDPGYELPQLLRAIADLKAGETIEDLVQWLNDRAGVSFYAQVTRNGNHLVASMFHQVID